MNKILLTILIIVVLIGGGYYYYQTKHKTASQNSSVPNTQTQPSSSMKPAANTQSSEAAMQTNQKTAVKEVTVEGKNFSFTPNTIKVNKGDTVKITFKNSGGTHDFMIDEFNVHMKPIQTDQEETATFTADKSGTFEYYCSIGNHRAMGMFGKLIVK